MPFAHGPWLGFRQGAYACTSNTGIGNGGPKGEKREKACRDEFESPD